MFDELDLGAKDYSGKGEGSGFEEFLSKPSPRPYQPFGGPMQQAYQPQPEPVDYSYGEAPVDQGPTFYDDLDAYEQLKNGHKQISQFSRENSRSAKRYEDLYSEFMDKEFKPFFESVGGFGDFETDDEYLSAVDEIYKSNLKSSQKEDGWLGASDDKTNAIESLKNFQQWDHPNGLRAKFLRLKAEKDKRGEVANRAKDAEFQLFEQLTNISIPAREALDEQLKAKNKKPGSTKKMNEMLDGMSWEQPVVGYDGEVQNLESVDPRAGINPAIGYDGQGNQSSKAQKERVAAAMRGDVKGILSRRKHIARERQLRDKGFFFSESGLLDGRPIGMSRRDVDLLDIEDMRKAGMTSFQGKPLDQAMTDLGGEERLEMAKVMQSVYSTKSNYEDAQLKFLKAAGSPKADKLRDAMEAAREDMQKTIGLAASYGLDNELFEQAETTGWLSAMGNAVKRGALMSEMSNYTPDFLTNTLDADEMQKFIEIASEIEKLPTSSTMKRVKETKSDGFLDAMGNLLFDNPAAIPEMFVESLSSFLPSTIKWLLPSAAAGAAVGSVIPGAGTAAGAAIGARASWGVASFVLEASGMALEGMQELNIDWKNPKVFAAAWTNESIRSKIQKKMVQKGTPIAIADMLTGMMAGKVMGVVNHTGNAVFKGGKLLNKEAFNAANSAVPRFSLMQKTRNAAAELGADSFMGMSGEYLGQWASKEPGEDWDWDAIAAEGLVGVGPGAVGAALEMRGPRANYFGNAPIEVGSEEQTETGTRGVVTRAGYSAPFQTFSSPEAMGDYLSTLPNTNPEAVEFTKGWISELYGMNGKEMGNLKIAISPRTPDANPRNRGTFESRDGQKIIYLNEEEFASDPMATFMHEAGHMARVITMDDKKLMDVWKTIGEDAQKDAYAQYFTKRPGIKLSDLDPATQKKVESSFKKTDDDILAEEWFSYQFAQFIMGKNSQVEPDVQGALQTYKEKLGDTYAQYAGTDAKGKELFGQIYAMLNLGPLPEDTQTAEPAPSGPKTDKDLQSNLNAMPGKPADKVKIAKTLNAMAGEKILSTDLSFYTPMEQGSLKAAGADIEESDKKDKKSGKTEKQDDEQVDKTPEWVEEMNNPKKVDISKLEKSSKDKKKDELRKAIPKVNTPGISKEEKSSARKKVDDLKKSIDQEDEKVDRELSFQTREAEMKGLDSMLKNMSKSDRIKLNKRINEVKNSFPDLETLDSKIDAAMEDLGPDASSGQIISKILNLDGLIKLAPRSFTKEMRKLLQESRGKLASNEDIEDVSFEITDEILSIKEQLRTRVDEIDKQIESLQKGPSQKPKPASQKPEAGETTIQAEIDALKNARKLVKTFLEAVAPEELNVEWKDIPAHAIFYASNGKKYSAEPMTLGQLADRRDGFKKGQLYYKNSKGELVEAQNESRTGQEILWDHINKFDIEQTGRTTEFGYTKEGVLIKPKKYEFILEAVKASAYFSKSASPKKDGGVGADPMGVARFEKTELGNKESQKGYPAGYQSNKGTNYAALIASRLGILNSMKPLSNDPSPNEILALKMANGRALELLGDPSETERDFNKAIYIALLEELGVEQSGMLSDPVLVEERDYAETEEYTRGALEKISNGTPVVAAIAGIPSTSKRQAFQRQVRDDDAASAQTEIVESKKMDRPDETNPVWEEYGKKGSGKAAPEIERKGTSEVVLNINGLKVPSDKAYKARRPDEDLDKPVPETEQHRSFTRGKVYETFDVVTSFAEGRTKREIAKFNKNRTNIQKSEELPTNPISIERENADLLSTTDINAAEFAEWYMSGKPEAQMADLQLVPSSKNNQQSKGGLGEGFLPYVFLDFARAMYKKLGLVGIAAETMEQAREAEKAAAKNQKSKYHKFKWNLEQGALLENGKINPKLKIFTKPADRMTPVGMAVLAKPIVQAVIDARGVDIYNQIDRSASVLLQRDIDRAEQEASRESLQEGAFERDEEMQELGSATQDIFNPDSESLSQEETKKGVVSAAEKALDENPDALKNKDLVSDELLEELYYSSTSSDLTNAAEKELQRRGVKALYVVREETADQLNKILNSDAKILTSDADPNLAKATLLGRIAGDSELIKEFKEWAGGKKQSLSKGSLKMDLVDRADPLNQLNKLFLKGFEAVGLDSSNPLYKALNVYGKYYQFFGEGDNSVEQARLEYYEPMIELMREYNVDERKIGEYLNARAAPSRNLQIETKALEALKEMEKDPEGPKSEKYKKIEKFFFNTTEDGKRTIKRDSGISTETAIKVVAEMEKEPKFVEFLDKFLVKYYKMNKEGLTTLASTGMIGQDTVSKEGVNEVEAMRKAMSRFDFIGGKADKYGNKYKSKVSALEDNYSYSPLQGFEGETENFYEQEAAWEEFGAGSNATGKGFDQKKSDLILQGAFGRYKSGAPDPSLTLGNSFKQHISSAILAQKNTVAQKFGMVYGMMRAVIYDKDGNEHFNTNRLTEEDKNDPIYQAYEELIKLKEPGNETAFKNLKSEFDQIFDPKGFEESETVTQYELQETGEIGIVRREMSQKFKNDPTAFTYRRNGIPQFIKFTSKSEGLRMADTMKNLRYENLPQILQGFNTVTRGMAQMFTSANPAFILPNFFRDVATAAIHLGEDDKKVLIKDALNFKNLSGFMKEIYKVEQKIHKGINPNTKDKEIMNLLASGDPKKILASGNRQAMFQYFKEAGGKVGYFRHESLPEKIKQIQKDLKGKKGWTKKGWKGMWQTIDSMNTAVENSIRASTFWAAIKDGRSADEAAHISRNVTVDFNQKGNLTQTFGALYVFFGASVNSMHRFYRTLSRRTPIQRAALIGGMASAALIVNLFNRLMDDDEDEEIPDYDTISTYKRDTNFILPVPAGLPDFFNDEKDTGYFSLPLPLGYNLFWTMGQVMGDMVAKNVFNRGGMGFFGSATRVQESFLNAFNPVGGASLITAAFPTAVTPLVELYANKNFMNKPIRYADRPFEVPKPAHMQDPRSTPDHWTKLSRSINEFMGGSDDVKGSLAGMMGKNPLYYNSDEDIEFDISGNQMKHLLYGYLGGPGQIADTLFGGMFSAAKGDLSVKNIGDIPVANRFMRATTYGSATRNSFLNLRDATKNAEKVMKSAKILGAKAYTTAMNDNKKLLQLSSQISAFDKQKNKMRRLKKQIEGSKALSDEQKTQRVDELQKKELNLMVTVIKKAQALGIS